MTTHNPYAWLTALAEQEGRRLLEACKTTQKPRLTLVTPDQMTSNTNEPKMNKSPKFEAAKNDLTELAAALEGAFSFQVGSIRIKPLSRSFYLQQEAAN